MNRLAELRNENKLSQRAIAKIFNISQSTYNNWENSNTQPSIEQLIALANYFNVSVDYLIGNSDEMGNIVSKHTSPEQFKLLKLYSEADQRIKTAVMVILENANKK